jgi:cephalosporin hydroxylase
MSSIMDNWIGGEQNTHEISNFVEFLETINPRNIMEIGVKRWGTSSLWFKFCKRNDGQLYVLDSNEQVFADWVCGCPSRVHPILGNSTDPQLIKVVHKLIPDRSLDMLFIDACHTFYSVSSDYRNYKSLVRVGGVIGLHDIVNHDTGVPNLWKIIKTKTSLEFIDQHPPEGEAVCGIGVIIEDE